AGEEYGGEPERQNFAPGETEQGRQNVEPVRRGVEEPAQVADLVPPSGELAVEVVADAAQREHQQRPAVTVRAAELGPEDEPQEERHTEEPRHAEDVGDGEDAVRLDACLLDLHPGASCGNTCVNDAS